MIYYIIIIDYLYIESWCLIMLKKIDKTKIVNISKVVVTILLLIQPIFDVIRASNIHDIQIFGFSLLEIVNIILVFVLGCLSILCGDSKKRFFRYFIFALLFIIYFVVHCYNMTLFDENIYPNHTLNFAKEFYYLYKTFINPLILMMSLYYLNVDKNYLLKIIRIFSLMISVPIILGDIFGFGYAAYGENGARCLKSIFDWFGFDNKYSLSFYELTCMGPYFSANQLSSITFMILPVLFYSAYEEKKLINYIELCNMILCMYMIGTKVSTYGVIAVFIMFFALYIFFLLHNKYKKNGIKLNNVKEICIIMIASLILFNFCPRRYEMKFDNNDISSVKRIENNIKANEEDSAIFVDKWNSIKKVNCYDMSNDEEDDFLSFFDNYSDYMGVSDFIINSYGANNNPEFWCNYLQTSNDNDYRRLKTSILREIYIDNNNVLDKYFGLGYNLNYIYTESDYSYQFYSYGIVGCLLFIGGYFVVICYSVYMMLKNKKELFNFRNLLFLSSPFLALFTAAFSGHVLERALPLLTLSILCSLILLVVRESIRDVND